MPKANKTIADMRESLKFSIDDYWHQFDNDILPTLGEDERAMSPKLCNEYVFYIRRSQDLAFRRGLPGLTQEAIITLESNAIKELNVTWSSAQGAKLILIHVLQAYA